MKNNVIEFSRVTPYKRSTVTREIAITPFRTINYHDVWCSYFHDEPLMQFDNKTN